MNSIESENLDSDDYMLACSFNDINDAQQCEQNSLRSHMNLNDHSKDNSFNFDNSFPQDNAQICSDGRNLDNSLFTNSRELLSDVYRQYDLEDGTHQRDRQSKIPNRHNLLNITTNECNVSNGHFYNISDSSKLPNEGSNAQQNFLTDSSKLTGSNNCSLYINSSNECNAVSESFTSITKTLRGIKRVPPLPPQSSSVLQISTQYLSNSSESSCEALSCTVLVDASIKSNIDLELPSKEKCNDNEQGDNCQKKEIIESLYDSDSAASRRIYQCSKCDKKFREKSHLVSHWRAHVNIRKFKCDKCDSMFKSEVNLRFHMQSHFEVPLKCPHCDKVFKARRAFSRHLRGVHSEENFECDQCSKKFKTKKNLLDHYGMHSGVRPFVCNICSKSFLHSSSLNTHLREHSQQDCSECLPSVEISSALNITQTEMIDSSIQNIFNDTIVDLNRKCSCGTVCVSECTKRNPSTLCVHALKPFLCSSCGRSFKLKSSLVSHMKTHVSIKQFKCDDCDKIFLKRLSYEIHMKRHRGERPEYMCDQCCQSYYSQFSLRRHYLKHTTQPNFICQICSKSCWNKDALQVHLRTHSKEKLFKCSICDKNFSHKSSLITHTRSVHPESKHIHQPVRSSEILSSLSR